MTERTVRESLASFGAALPDPARLPERALARGRARLRRRRAVLRGVTAGAAVTVAVAAFTAVVPATPAEASVECHHDRVVARGSARVSPDGVRLTVTNATAATVLVAAGDAGAFAPPGRTAVRIAARPGRVTVSCGTAAVATLTVHDPDGHYVDDRLHCAASVVDLRGTEAGTVGDPVALTRQRLAGVPRGAGVETAGYAEGDRRVVRVRDGEAVVGVAVWHALPGRTWVLDEVRLCAPLALA